MAAIQAQANYQDLTIPRRNIKDYTLDEVHPCPGSVSYQQTEAQSTTTSGRFEVLPFEIFHILCVQLDLDSMHSLGATNRRVASLVNSVPHFQTLRLHAPNALYGISAIKASQTVTCSDLYAVLCTSKCENCGGFGGYLYILACARVCFLCFTEVEKYLSLRYCDAAWKFSLAHNTLKTLRQMRGLPGIYSPSERKNSKQVNLIDYRVVQQAAISLHGSIDAMEESRSREFVKKMQEHNIRLAKATTAQSGSQNCRIRARKSTNRHDTKSGDPFRFMAIVQFPCYDKTSLTIEHGFYCVGCDNGKIKPYHWRRRFDIESFEWHVLECDDFKNGMHGPR